jgi:hypothetical protein
MQYIILCLLSFLLMLCVFKFDCIKTTRIIYAVVLSVTIQIVLFITSTNIMMNIKYSTFLSLFAVATYTDIKEEKILEINIIMLYVAIGVGLIVDLSNMRSSHRDPFVLLLLLIVLAVSIFLTLVKAISSGDIPLILALSYLWTYKFLFVIGISAGVFVMYATPRMIYKIIKKKERKFYVAAAPSFFIAALSFIFINSFYGQFFDVLI